MRYSSWLIFDGSIGTDTCLPSSVQFLVAVLNKLCVIIPVFTTNLTFVVVFCEFQVLGLADIGPYITKIPPSLIWVNDWNQVSHGLSFNQIQKDFLMLF